MTQRDDEILSFLLQDPEQSFSTGDIQRGVNGDRSTLFRRLAALASQGMVIAEGEGKWRRYRVKQSSDAFLEWELNLPPGARKEVTYNPLLLDNYEPNKTFMLTSEQRANMRFAASGGQSDTVCGDNYRRILDSLIIDLSYASSNLENVKISWLDTKTLFEFGEKPEGLSEGELRIVLNHKDAIRFMVVNDLDFCRRDLFDIHSFLTDGLFKEDGVAGRIRTKLVEICGSQYQPLANPHQISEEFDRFIEKAHAIADPFEKAVFALTFISYLQPFQDGNKRTARLSTNLPLLKQKLPPFSFADIKGKDYNLGMLAFYERGRSDFIAKAFHDSYLKTAPRYAKLMKMVGSGGMLDTMTLDDLRNTHAPDRRSQVEGSQKDQSSDTLPGLGKKT